MAIPQDLLDDLGRRRGALKRADDARAVLDGLFEPGTFQEYGRFADHAIPGLDHGDVSFPGDGVVTGVGYADGRPLAAFAQSAAVAGGSVGRAHAERIAAILDHAGRAGMPVAGFLSSLGGRLEEGGDVQAGHGAILGRMARLSGVVPLLAAVIGPCPGTAAMIPGLADFVVMVRARATLHLTGPEVIEAVAGFAPTAEETGGAATHAEVSGLAHFVVADAAEAAAVLRRLAGFLPANNRAPAPDRDAADFDPSPDPGMDALAPGSPVEPYDVRPIVGRLVDGGDFLEVHAAYGTSALAGFARVGGLVCGLVASQPRVRAGVLDIRACDKIARFVRFCDAYAIPVVTLVDAPGFLPGADQERAGIVRHAARLVYAYAEAVTPKVTVLMGRAFGGAGLAMGARAIGGDLVFAWPGADFGLSGGDAEADRTARHPSPYLTDGRFTVADVIEPARTRAVVGLALRTLAAKRDLRPPRRHGTLAP